MRQSLTRGSRLTESERFFKKMLHAQGNHWLPDQQHKKAVWLVDWKAYGLKYCSLYVVCTDSRWPCKIGISVNARKRVMGIQTGVWRPISVHKCFYLPTVNEARALERKVHDTLTIQGKWLHGEWFDMRPEQAADLIEFEAMILGLECRSEIEDEEIVSDLRSTFFEMTAWIDYQEKEGVL